MSRNANRRYFQRLVRHEDDREDRRVFKYFAAFVVAVNVAVVALILGLVYRDQDLFDGIITEHEMQELMDYKKDMVYKGKGRELPQLVDALAEEELPYQQEIEQAEQAFTLYSPYAHEQYYRLLEKLPKSFRVNYGMARVFEADAYIPDRRLAMESLANATVYYLKAYKLIHDGVKPGIKETIALRIIDIYEDTGNLAGALRMHDEILKDHPDMPYVHNRRAMTFAKLDKYTDAVAKYKEVLRKWPDYVPTLTNYGYLMYSTGKWQLAAKYLSKAIDSDVPETQKGMFYQALGASLERLGKKQTAIKYYEKAVEKGIFPSIYQRTIDYKGHLLSIPWWQYDYLEGFTYTKDRVKFEHVYFQTFYRKLISKWNTFQYELKKALASPLLRHHFKDVEYYRENHQSDAIREAYIFHHGFKTPACQAFPETTRLFESFPPARDCMKCEVKYMVIKKAHVWPKCEATNAILTTHLGISIPKKVSIRVHNETRTWTEGDVLIFSSSFEHEIWNNGTGVLMLLSFDMWHPELEYSEIRELNTF